MLTRDLSWASGIGDVAELTILSFLGYSSSLSCLHGCKTLFCGLLLVEHVAALYGWLVLSFCPSVAWVRLFVSWL